MPAVPSGLAKTSHNSTERAAEYCVCAQNSTLFNVHFMLTSKTPAANTSPSGTLPNTPPQNQTLRCKGLQNTPPSGTQGLTGIDVFKHASPVNSVFFTLPSPVLLTTPSRKWTALTVICQRRAHSKLAHSPAYCSDLHRLLQPWIKIQATPARTY